MKKLIAILIASVMLAGCTTHTEFGACVGIGEKQNPKLDYKVSATNLVIGIVFIEMIAPPVIVAVDEFYCPVGKNDTVIN